MGSLFNYCILTLKQYYFFKQNICLSHEAQPSVHSITDVVSLIIKVIVNHFCVVTFTNKNLLIADNQICGHGLNYTLISQLNSKSKGFALFPLQ